MLSVLLLGVAVVGGGLALATMGTKARHARGRSARRDESPALNPRTQRPWCEMTVSDWTPEERTNRPAILRWARCSTTTETMIASMVSLLNDDFENAETDGEAMTIANVRDDMHRAWDEAHATVGQQRVEGRGRRSRRRRGTR